MRPVPRIHRHDAARRWQLTPWGWILTVAVPVLIVLALVDPSRGVIAALIVVIVVWAGLLAASFPSSRARYSPPGDQNRDYGREAAEEWERGHGPRG